jgi:serine/threonine protein kinase
MFDVGCWVLDVFQDFPRMNPETPGRAFRPPGSHGPPPELDYELIRLIGQGGYGEVWLVRDQAGMHRACKVVYRESFAHDRPYEREYEGIRKFEPVSRTSDNQVKILHVGRRDQAGYFYYIMELADDANGGPAIDPERYIPKTLKSEVQRRGRLPAKECIELGLALSAALENLHEHGLIHRDIKPANIIFVNGQPRLADIGLVTEADVTVSYVGTGGFIPPEGPTSPQADIYGLGKVLYEISTGKDRLEFPELPVDFTEWPDHELLLELNAVMSKACDADLRQRYASARELRADLALLCDGKSVRSARSVKRKLKFAAQTTLVTAAIALVTAGVIHFQKQRAQTNPDLPAPKAVHKIPLPEAGRLAEAEAKLQQQYRQPLAATRSASKLAAASELRTQSATAADPAIELASLRLAALLSAEATDYPQAMETCGQMQARFEMDILPVKLELLTKAAPFAQSPKARSDFAEVCVATGFAAIAADDYASAARLTELSRSAAQGSVNPHAIRQAAFFDSEVARCQREYDRIKSFIETLRQKPGDPHASLAVGKFLCFVKSDWETGLPLMAHGDDPSLKAVLESESIHRPTASTQQIALGDAWWELAGTARDPEKIYYQRRARYWYLKGIASASEPDKTRVRERLLDRIKAVPTQSGEVHFSSRVSRGELIELYSDEVRWKSNRGSTGDQVNHVMLGDLKPGTLQVIRNSGATRLLPDNVDFSTARLTVDHKPRRRGRTELKIEADHVQIHLTDPPLGTAEFEITVTFGNLP